MNIYILHTENQKVRIEFTPDELEVEKFHQITNGIINKYNGVWEGNSVILTPKKAQQKDNIGIMVDDVRESLICDVLAEDDPKKNKTKSLSLKFTPHPTQTPEPEPEPVEERLKDLIKRYK
ncbi:MAG: hypothetical protein A4E25_00342 [Methanobacterium sp. PtaB.Bin024]|nr:MAG: hypothetical protein A4E25_00342 [Methanobacterium sp. PtaB.Bin024]